MVVGSGLEAQLREDARPVHASTFLTGELALNGSPVLQASDADPLGNGVSGLQAYTYPMHEQLDIRWHEFAVHSAG